MAGRTYRTIPKARRPLLNDLGPQATGGRLLAGLAEATAGKPHSLSEPSGKGPVPENVRRSLNALWAEALTPALNLHCRETYYAWVVLLAGIAWLQARRSVNGIDVDFADIANGRAFQPYGIANPVPDGLRLDPEDMPELLELFHKIKSLIPGFAQTEAIATDHFRPFYESLIPGPVRHAAGEHYTPDWLAAHVLDEVGYRGQASRSLLDPCCGSGSFLIQALVRQQGKKQHPMICGMDLNPLAVLTARINYLLHAPWLLDGDREIELPILQRDAILAADDGLFAEPMPWSAESFSFVVGNPPWVNWESIDADYREATGPFWHRYGLFVHQGMDVILGKGKKDLSTLITIVAADRYLACGGKMGFLITQSVFKSGGAAEGFRRFELPGGTGLKVLKAEDLAGVKPFPDAAARTAVLYLKKGEPTQYPIPYFRWDAIKAGERPVRVRLAAEPSESGNSASPWLTGPSKAMPALRKMLGVSAYQGREGANTGGANGVFWVEVLDRPEPGLVRIRNLAKNARNRIESVEAVIEDALVFPLLKGNDVERWHAVPSAHILMTQDPFTRRGIRLPMMRRNYPKTLAYLDRFQPILKERAAYKRYFKEQDAFYTMFDVGEYTFAPVKVVWHRFGSRLRAAVVIGRDRPVICQETHVQVECAGEEEAWYLAGIMNSLPIEAAIKGFSMVGGKNFGGTGMIKQLAIPRYDGSFGAASIAQMARSVAMMQMDAEALDQAVTAYMGLTREDIKYLRSTLRET